MSIHVICVYLCDMYTQWCGGKSALQISPDLLPLPISDHLPIFGLGCLDFLILSCMSCLYILEINPLLVASFANIFSHFVGCLFVLFMVSFAVLSTFLHSPKRRK